MCLSLAIEMLALHPGPLKSTSYRVIISGWVSSYTGGEIGMRHEQLLSIDSWLIGDRHHRQMDTIVIK